MPSTEHLNSKPQFSGQSGSVAWHVGSGAKVSASMPKRYLWLWELPNLKVSIWPSIQNNTTKHAKHVQSLNTKKQTEKTNSFEKTFRGTSRVSTCDRIDGSTAWDSDRWWSLGGHSLCIPVNENKQHATRQSIYYMSYINLIWFVDSESKCTFQNFNKSTKRWAWKTWVSWSHIKSLRGNPL